MYEGDCFSKLFFENYLCGSDVAEMLDGEMAVPSGWLGVETRGEFEILDESPAVWGGRGRGRGPRRAGGRPS